MATLGNLVAYLSMNATGFNAGAKQAENGMDRLQHAAGKTRAIVGKMAAGLGVAFSAGAVISGIKKSMQAVDGLAKTADKIGIATEQLAGLRHAADLSGVATEKLDNSLQRMVRNISEASIGKGTAGGALEELRLSAVRLNQLSPDRQIYEIADALNKVENQADKVRLAYNLFGREGVSLLNTLSVGSEGLREAQQEAEKLGLAINRIDAASIEAANDAITRMQRSLDGLTNSMAVTVSPIVNLVSTEITRLFTDPVEACERLGQSIKINIIDSLRSVIDLSDRAFGILLDKKNAISDGLRTTFKNTAGEIAGIRSAFTALISGRNPIDAFFKSHKMARNLADAALGGAGGVKGLLQAERNNILNEILPGHKGALEAIKPSELKKNQNIEAQNAATIGRLFEMIGKSFGPLFQASQKESQQHVTEGVEGKRRGSAEFYSSIYRAQRNEQDKQAKIAANTAQTVEKLKDVANAVNTFVDLFRSAPPVKVAKVN